MIKRHRVVSTYEMFFSRPRRRCGPAFPRCLLSSESTEGHCLMDFHGPGRKADGNVSEGSSFLHLV